MSDTKIFTLRELDYLVKGNSPYKVSYGKGVISTWKAFIRNHKMGIANNLEKFEIEMRSVIALALSVDVYHNATKVKIKAIPDLGSSINYFELLEKKIRVASKGFIKDDTLYITQLGNFYMSWNDDYIIEKITKKGENQ